MAGVDYEQFKGFVLPSSPPLPPPFLILPLADLDPFMTIGSPSKSFRSSESATPVFSIISARKTRRSVSRRVSQLSPLGSWDLPNKQVSTRQRKS